jgi:S1-C subfamily serine protease/regulation of enolase protein 1 (concanavalin A-like superfamily)
MSLPFTCPCCGRNGRLPESFVGDRVKCPACQTISPVSRAVKDIYEVAPPEPKPARIAPAASPAPAKSAPAPKEEGDEVESPRRSLTPFIAAGAGAAGMIVVFGIVMALRGGGGEVKKPAAEVALPAANPAPADEAVPKGKDLVAAPGAGNVSTALAALVAQAADEPKAAPTAPSGDIGPASNPAPAPASAPPQSAEDRTETVRRIKDATVFLKVRAGKVQASGSGFVIKDEGSSLLIATNHHVISPHMDGPEDVNDPRKTAIAPVVTAVFRSGSGAGAEQSASAQVIATDREANRDLAILRVRGVRNPPTPIELTRGSEPFETMAVLIYGFPFGDINKMLDGATQGNPAITINKGSVSSLRRDPFGQVAHVQIDGSINPGNSGGPVVDEQGRLVGVSVAQIRNTTIGFAVPPGELNRMLDGRIGRVSMALRSETNGMADIQVEAKLIDPLNRIRDVELLYAPSRALQAGMNPGADGSWPPLAGATRVNLSLSGPTAFGVIHADVRSLPGRRLMVQTAYQDGAGRTLYTHPEPFTVPARPSTLAAVGTPRVNGPGAALKPSFAGLGPLIDPGKNCKIDRTESKLTIDIPAGVHLLSDELEVKNSPMTLSEVNGDFVAQVKIAGALLPGVEPARLKGKNLPFTFQSGGLLLWQDKNNFLRLERSAKATRNRVTLQTEVLVEICKNGKPAGHVYAPVPAGPLNVRIARLDGNIYCMFGPDGKQWISLKSLAVNFPDKLQIGLSASNAAKEPLSARFEDFVLITDKKALDESNQP